MEHWAATIFGHLRPKDYQPVRLLDPTPRTTQFYLNTAKILRDAAIPIKVDDDVDCWYFNQESMIALEENIESGDKRD